MILYQAVSTTPLLHLALCFVSISLALPLHDRLYDYSPIPQTSTSNVAVYYGQIPATPYVNLTTICADGDVDIVILAFMTAFAGSGGYPTLNLRDNCWQATEAQQLAGATGLVDCVASGFAHEVSVCQNQGKRVLLSLGGATAETTMNIPSAAIAQQYAQATINLFLQPTNQDYNLRPFGSVVLDGIDIDIEHGNGAFLEDYIRELRNLTSYNTGQQILISAAPQCPDLTSPTSIPWMSFAYMLDYIYVQFYDNPGCDLSSVGTFMTSLDQWSNAIAYSRGTAAIPQLFVGASATPQVSSGYASANDLTDILQQVRIVSSAQIGGLMFWDGVWAMESNVDDVSPQGGVTFMSMARQMLQS